MLLEGTGEVIEMILPLRKLRCWRSRGGPDLCPGQGPFPPAETPHELRIVPGG